MQKLSFHNSLLDAIHNIADIIIRNPRTSRETEAHLEESFLYTIGIYWSTCIDRLLVHRFPDRTTLYLLVEHKHTQSLNIIVWLAIRYGRVNCMDYLAKTEHVHPLGAV